MSEQGSGDRRAFARAALARWLRRQLREPLAAREHLEAAVATDNPAEFRRVLGRFPFAAGQRRYVEDLLRLWEDALANDTTSP
ncbi:MAG: hypothetical protein U0531_10120 [Dehalococcoidia bacterium]